MLGGCKSEDLPLPSEKKFLGEHSLENGKMKKEKDDSDDSIQPRGMGS